MCPENYKQHVIVQKVSGNFKSIYASAMPDCNLTVTLILDNVAGLPIGAWLWAYSLGFLEIVSFNPITGEVVVRNPCASTCQEQAAAGTPIPACTDFVLTVPVCGPTSNQNTLYPYLALDFTAPTVVPAVGSCIQITLTNVNGIAVNKNVGIGSGTYRVQAVTDATHITICNDDAGAVPGTPVVAKDGGGNFIVPIVLIDANPCSLEALTQGVLLACNGGVTTPMTGNQSGQVWVLEDPETGEGNYRTLGIPVLNCTELTVCLTLDPELPLDTPYLATVLSTAEFSDGDIVTIGGTEFVIDSITDATHMYLIPEEQPNSIQTYNVGATVCSADCCTIINSKLTDIAEWTPEGDFNGAASISAWTVLQAKYSIVGQWVMFKLSVTFTVTGGGGGSGSTILTITSPPEGGDVEVTDAYLAHVDTNAIDVEAYWRKTNGNGLLVFRALNAEFANGPNRVDIDGKYALV